MLSLAETLMGEVGAANRVNRIKLWGTAAPQRVCGDPWCQKLGKTGLKLQEKQGNGDKTPVSTLGIPLLVKTPRSQAIPAPAPPQVHL